MPRGATRGLTDRERARLSPGLLNALAEAGVEPVIAARPAWLARAASLWRRHVPVLTLPGQIYWPDAWDDFSPSNGQMAVLQHELQHLLEFGSGALTPLRYLLKPHNWRYGYHLFPGCAWADFGAEQRARLVEHWWWIEQGLRDSLLDPPEDYRRLIPWLENPD
jgi:hypothetical protein